METENEESMKVNPKYIKEAIEEYNHIRKSLYEQNHSYSTQEINGGIYKVINMTAAQFAQLNNAKDMNDIQWT